MKAVRNYFQSLIGFLRESPSDQPPPTPIFDRFCVIFIALDWILFGAMHFSNHNATVLMLPSSFPFPDIVVVVSGIIEVTIGILLFYRRARRVAALVSLILLILYIAPVIHILGTGDASPFCGTHDTVSAPGAASPSAIGIVAAAAPFACSSTSGLNLVWRILLVPHNIFMAICSIHVLRHPYPSPWPLERSKPGSNPPSGVSARGGIALVALVLLLCNSAGFLAVLGGVTHSATAAMWMMMCLAAGALPGFLFAVPRANKKLETRSSLLPNRNIEAISDWLTKIFVGLGLVNLKSIGEFLTTQSTSLAATLGTSADFSLALIVYFAIAGFLEGYIITRMFLQLYFIADQPPRSDQ